VVGEKMSKIFVLGYNKSGTISLSQALQILGYDVSHTGSGDNFMETLIKLSNNLEFGMGILDGIDEYDCYLDYPIYEPTIFSHIVIEYPDAKYISLTKNLDDYVDSALRAKIRDIKNGNKNTWNWLGVGDEEVFRNYPEYQKEWVKRRTTFKHKSNLKHLSNLGNTENILHMNICDDGDGWRELCKFLNKEIPNIEFPYENKNEIV
jgi:hypothetical protein